MTEVDVADEGTRPTPQGSRYVYGINPVLEALRYRSDQIEKLYVSQGHLPARPAAEILSRARKAGIRVQKVVRERLGTLAEGGVHQGVVAEVREFEYATLEELLAQTLESKRTPLFVVLDEIQDPQNFGAIVRSAHALGANGVIVGKDRAAPVSGVVSKASAGAIEYVPIARVTNLSRALEQLKKAGLWILAADPHSALSLPEQKLQGPFAVVIGSEGGGIREGVLSHCDYRLSIPMAGKVGSLNASVATAIVLYEIARQRENAPRPDGLT